MRLGFVGVGRHAQRMAAAFRECGAEIVAFDRLGEGTAEGFGVRKSTERMLRSANVDAIVCCATPEVNQAIATACEPYQKPCCISKPFPLVERLWQAEHMSHPLYVDLWRLYSPAWLALKATVNGRKITDIAINFCGSGPVRASHSGLLDYGPHALAFLLDLGIAGSLEWKLTSRAPNAVGDLWRAMGTGDVSAIIYTGNRVDSVNIPPPNAMEVFVETDDGGQYRWRELESQHVFESGGSVHMQHWRDLALHGFCRAFLAGAPSDTLRISCEAMRLLREAEPL